MLLELYPLGTVTNCTLKTTFQTIGKHLRLLSKPSESRLTPYLTVDCITLLLLIVNCYAQAYRPIDCITLLLIVNCYSQAYRRIDQTKAPVFS
jgi:hypothetical protein